MRHTLLNGKRQHDHFDSPGEVTTQQPDLALGNTHCQSYRVGTKPRAQPLLQRAPSVRQRYCKARLADQELHASTTSMKEVQSGR
jgi:hypothetical protein